MLSDLAAGLIDKVVAYDLDRPARRPKDLERGVRQGDQAGRVRARGHREGLPRPPSSDSRRSFCTASRPSSSTRRARGPQVRSGPDRARLATVERPCTPRITVRGVRLSPAVQVPPPWRPGVGGEFGNDQNHGAGSLGRDRRQEAFEEVPGAVASVGRGCRGAGGCDADAHRVHQVTLVSGSSMPGPACSALVPGLRHVNPAVTVLPASSLSRPITSLSNTRKSMTARVDIGVVAWLWFLS
ncbi:hypothetical protein AB4212_04465 [Streptomyces sp. 2MCAF27]